MLTSMPLIHIFSLQQLRLEFSLALGSSAALAILQSSSCAKGACVCGDVQATRTSQG